MSWKFEMRVDASIPITIVRHFTIYCRFFEGQNIAFEKTAGNEKMVITGFGGRPRVVVIRCMPNQGHSSALSVHSTPFAFCNFEPRFNSIWGSPDSTQYHIYVFDINPGNRISYTKNESPKSCVDCRLQVL